MSHCSRRERKKDLSLPDFFTSLPPPFYFISFPERPNSFHLPLNVDSEKDAQADPLRILLPVCGRDVAELGTPTYARLATSGSPLFRVASIYPVQVFLTVYPHQSQPLQSRERSRTWQTDPGLWSQAGLLWNPLSSSDFCVVFDIPFPYV